MTHINQRLPLRVSEGTPSRIDTADGWSFGIEWKNTSHADPYAEAEAFAAYLVRAVNAHETLAKKLDNCVHALTFAIDGWDETDPYIIKLRSTRDGAAKALADLTA